MDWSLDESESNSSSKDEGFDECIVCERPRRNMSIIETLSKEMQDKILRSSPGMRKIYPNDKICQTDIQRLEIVQMNRLEHVDSITSHPKHSDKCGYCNKNLLID